MARIPPRESAIDDAKNAARHILESEEARSLAMDRALLRLGTLRALIDSDTSRASRIVELARSGDKRTDAVLREIACGFIAKRCVMPPILGDYLVHRLSDDFPTRPGQRGRKRDTNLYRDLAIVRAVAEVVARGFHATRNNDGSEHKCACSIVSDCLDSLGVKISYDGVAKVWRRRKQVCPSGAFRASPPGHYGRCRPTIWVR
jgi:hypothetical protein